MSASKIRKHFAIESRGAVWDVRCLLCNKVARSWDYRDNALGVGYTHVVTEHYPPMFRKANFVEQI